MFFRFHDMIGALGGILITLSIDSRSRVRMYNGTLKNIIAPLEKRIHTGSISVETAAREAHSARNILLIQIRRSNFAPALLFSTLRKPVLPTFEQTVTHYWCKLTIPSSMTNSELEADVFPLVVNIPDPLINSGSEAHEPFRIVNNTPNPRINTGLETEQQKLKMVSQPIYMAGSRGANNSLSRLC